MPNRETLLVVASNPPSQTSGQRTLARIDLATGILGFDTSVVTNLFAYPTYRSGGISELGGEPDGWLAARPGIVDGLDRCDAVLLAYGTQPPAGDARAHHRDQVGWLDAEISARALPSWWVGGAPRHPSRWQRYTWRERPDVAFLDALRVSLTVRSVGAVESVCVQTTPRSAHPQ